MRRFLPDRDQVSLHAIRGRGIFDGVRLLTGVAPKASDYVEQGLLGVGRAEAEKEFALGAPDSPKK